MFRTIAILSGLLLSASILSAEVPPQTGIPAFDTGGDNPLTTSYTWQGHGGVEVAALAIDGLSNPSGTIVEDSIPANSTIVYAYFGTMGWHRSVLPASAIFNGNQLPSVQPAANDPTPSYQLSFYKWDVTSYVTGNGSYSFSLIDHTYCYLAFLVIVYENPLLPPVMVAVNDGSEALQNASSATVYTGFRAGDGMVKILTEAGNSGGTDESIEFNGQVLAGPGDIFCCNIGDHADYFELELTNVTGEDTLIITTGSDQIGIHLAILIGGSEPLTVTFTPHNPPIRIPAGGGNFVFNAAIENTSDSLITFDAWTEVILPNGVVYGPVILRSNLIIPASATIMRQVTQFVPGYAPPGDYTYVGCAGDHPGSVLASDSFPFTKLAGDGVPNHHRGWSVSGWFGDESSSSIQHSSFSTHYSYPNPFNTSTVLSFELRDASFVQLAVYDISGREVSALAEEWMPAGHHSMLLNASELSSGIYFARLQIGDLTQTMKLLLVK